MKNFFQEKRFWVILFSVHLVWLVADLMNGQDWKILLSRICVLGLLLAIIGFGTFKKK